MKTPSPEEILSFALVLLIHDQPQVVAEITDKQRGALANWIDVHRLAVENDSAEEYFLTLFKAWQELQK